MSTFNSKAEASNSQVDIQQNRFDIGDVRQIITSCGALITNDHFVYASGEHGNGWIAKDLINLDPRRPYRLGAMLAEAIFRRGIEADVVCGPAIGGVICSQYTALALGIKSVFAERVETTQGEIFELKRKHSQVIHGKRVLIVDDVVNTGYSSKLVMDAVRSAGGYIVGLATWINRGNVSKKDFVIDHFVWLDEIKLPSIPANECRLCKNHIPVNVDYAHGADYMHSLNNKPI